MPIQPLLPAALVAMAKWLVALPLPIMVMWKLKYNDTTTTPVVITKIDVANTLQTINKIGQDSFTLMSMQSHVLDHLHNIAAAITKGCFWYTTRHQHQQR